MLGAVKIQVRFSDLDVLGHVNNNVYLSFFEIARVHYFGHMLGENWNWTTNGVILAKNNVEYLKPVLLSHEPYVTLFVDYIGTKSFSLNYELHVNGKLHTTGGSTLVCFDASINETISIPEVMKEELLKLKN
ncbi:MAG: acyl-CoA thioesterase [Crocinitomicaceae bacterium]|nr:acyl-CoA thioesterase [Crocinitomicaceae bacterium]